MVFAISKRRTILFGVLVLAATGGVATTVQFHASADKASAPAAVDQGFTSGTRPAAIAALVKAGVPATEAAKRIDAQPAQIALASRLSRTLGSSTAGSYLDQATGRLVVTVLDRSGASKVTAAGATARTVTRSGSDLAGTQSALAGAVPAGGTVAVDVTTNQVVVNVPSGADASGVKAAAARYGSAVRVESTAPAVEPQALYGGQQIVASAGWICSTGFMARSGSTYYVVTAGHCTSGLPTWTRNGTTLGPSTVSRFPSTDYGAIRITSPTTWSPQGAVVNGSGTQTITGTTQVPVGGTVCKTGRTTGTTCGQVRAYNVTVRYSQGAVNNTIQTNVCTQPGDSGGALFAGSQAQGIVSGGTTGGCTSTSQSFFQPIGPALSGLGLSLL